MKRQKILIIFSMLLLLFTPVSCKENSENKTESISDIEFSENISEGNTEISDKTEFTSEKSLKIPENTEQEVSEITYTSENISAENSDDVIITEETPENALQDDMPIITYDNYEQDSPVTTSESTEYEESISTQPVIELPFVPVG